MCVYWLRHVPTADKTYRKCRFQEIHPAASDREHIAPRPAQMLPSFRIGPGSVPGQGDEAGSLCQPQWCRPWPQTPFYKWQCGYLCVLEYTLLLATLVAKLPHILEVPSRVRVTRSPIATEIRLALVGK